MYSPGIDVGVVGGGVIGMTIALELIERGAQVTLYEKESACGHGASGASAAMLAPACEAALDASWLFDLCLESAALWRPLASKLEHDGGCGADFSGSLVSARTDDERAVVARMVSACHRKGVEAVELSKSAARKLEPGLGDSVAVSVFLPGDGQLDPPATMCALQKALTARGANIRTGRAVRGIDRRDDGRLHICGGGAHEALVWAAGYRGAEEIELDGAAYRPVPEVRPVKGQILAVSRENGAPSHVIRCGHGYIAPKAGRVLIGASSVWDSSDTTPDPAVSDALIAHMAMIAPIIADLPRLDHWAGVRPGSPDGAPLIGWSDIKGMYIATGHFRNGVLLAPVTARIVAADLTGGTRHPLADFVSPRRFSKGGMARKPLRYFY